MLDTKEQRQNRGAVIQGHMLAFFTVLVWGTTFISTKLLLRSFSPIEILFVRFLMGYCALWLFYPKRLVLKDKRHEWLFVGAGLSGITLYFLFENIALTLTTASNVGVIVVIAPFFTALLSMFFFKYERPNIQFFIGFLVAITGVALISYNGNAVLKLNPLGDFLAALAAATWAVYSIFIKKISALGYHSIQITRWTFFYGLAFMLPLLAIMDFDLQRQILFDSKNFWHFLFLGFGASALCFATWTMAVDRLGVVKSSVYVYLVPVLTVVNAVLFLQEPLTPTLAMGASLALLGLWLSETKLFSKAINENKRRA